MHTRVSARVAETGRRRAPWVARATSRERFSVVRRAACRRAPCMASTQPRNSPDHRTAKSGARRSPSVAPSTRPRSRATPQTRAVGRAPSRALARNGPTSSSATSWSTVSNSRSSAVTSRHAPSDGNSANGVRQDGGRRPVPRVVVMCVSPSRPQAMNVATVPPRPRGSCEVIATRSKVSRNLRFRPRWRKPPEPASRRPGLPRVSAGKGPRAPGPRHRSKGRTS